MRKQRISEAFLTKICTYSVCKFFENFFYTYIYFYIQKYEHAKCICNLETFKVMFLCNIFFLRSYVNPCSGDTSEPSQQKIFVHSLTHSLTYSLIHSLTHSLTHSFNHSFTHPLIHSQLIHSLINSIIHSLNHPPTHSLTHSLIHSPTHSFIQSSLNHSLTRPLTHSLRPIYVTSSLKLPYTAKFEVLRAVCCCCSLVASDMFLGVAGQRVTDISKGSSNFNFRVKKSQKCS